MCLEIDPYSIIHRHILRRIAEYEAKDERPFSKWFVYKYDLELLATFHISLGTPNLEHYKVGDSIPLRCGEISKRAFIGDIALADVHISETDNKRSAWIPLYPETLNLVLPLHVDLKGYVPPQFFGEKAGDKLLHISLANYTGKRHHSIARPEDCIIDTLTP